jgi:hypothetical protein
MGINEGKDEKRRMIFFGQGNLLFANLPSLLFSSANLIRLLSVFSKFVSFLFCVVVESLSERSKKVPVVGFILAQQNMTKLKIFRGIRD